MSHREPIAIIGIGCRFPGGARGPAAFWSLLCDGVDAVSELPSDRWNSGTFFDPRPGQAGKSISRWAGSVGAIDLFDAGFFGVSRREAERMDPQQRMLLQAAWEAIDDGGVVLDPATGAETGVFVGVSTYDYALLQSTVTNQSAIDLHTATGGAVSIAANRISHCLNLRGPSLSVDTACSSSLVAVHLACSSLWNGECASALAGGVNVIVTATPFISFSRSGMLSPDGRCKAFDAAANGFVRAEGCGVVLLKPLSAALADGNPVYAVILGTAANQDGRTPGISLPSAAAQEALVRDACRVAGVAPNQVHYVEAHGTGTPVGDPIEAAALGRALGEGRDPGTPLLIGSVKTNIGHMEAGAGIAGIIKTALALSHGRIPPSLHFRNPNPNIDFETLKLRVVQEVEPFPRGDGPPRAGVNSFGFGGTNAHAILQAPPEPAPRRVPETRAHLLALSARCEESLRGLAQKFADVLGESGAGAGASLDDVCFTAARHRTRHPLRLCVAAGSPAEMTERLRAFAAGESRAGLSSAHAAADAPPVFVFSGQGPQWWGMGRELLDREPVFRAKIEECDAILRELGPWSLVEEMRRDEAHSRIEDAAIGQPAIFALQVALAALWRSWGVEPAAAVGHSVGEVAAAHVAGVLDLREAARVIFHRGRCMSEVQGHGRMLATALSWEQADEAIAPYHGRVSIAANNSPSSVTLSGDADAIDEITRELERRSVSCRPLRVRYAFHSPHMDPVRDQLLRSLVVVVTEPALVPLWSTVSGAECAGDDFAASYWWHNVRMPVRFADAIDATIAAGYTTYLEIGPHPVLTGSVRECLARRSVSGTTLASLRRKEPEQETILAALGALHAAGRDVNWKALYPFASAVRLPSYAWREESYWHEIQESREARLSPPEHPLLERRMVAADPTWQTRLDLEALPFLRDHRVEGHVVFPAAGYVEMALAAARVLFGDGPCVLEDADFHKTLVLKDSEDAPRIQLSHHRQDATFAIASGTGGRADGWTTHVTGTIRAHSPGGGGAPIATGFPDVAGAEQVESDAIYDRFRRIGLPYGPAFRCIETAWRRDGEVLGRIRLAGSPGEESGDYRIHPAILDACFQLLLLAVPAADVGETPALHLPVQIARLRFLSRPGAHVWCRARLAARGRRAVIGDVDILDDLGQVVIEIAGLRCQEVRHGTRDGSGGIGELLYETRWTMRPHELVRPEPPPAMRPIGTRRVALPVEAAARRLRKRTAAEFRGGRLDDRLDALCSSYIVAALRELGWKPSNRDGEDPASLSKRLRIAPRHRQVFARYVSFLGAGDAADAEAGWAQALDEFPNALAELSLIRRCGRRLAAVLRGDVDPLELIFPDGSLSATEHLYQDSVSFRGSNLLVAEAVAAVVKTWPEGRPLRVLEIGAGTGGLTLHVLPRLPADRTDYVFSDVSNAFFSAAESKFFGVPFVRYQLFDVEKPAEEQGLSAGSFDLVLASDAMHAAADLRSALANVRSALAPGGLLVLLEVDRPARWPDLVFGLTEGWWRFADHDVRPAYPLIGAGRWCRLLREGGFVNPVAISDRTGRAPARHTVVLAAAPHAAAREVAAANAERHELEGPATWLVLGDRAGTAARLADLLERRGDHVVTVRTGPRYGRTGERAFEVDPASPADVSRLVAEVRASGAPPISDVLHLWSLDAAPPSRLTTALLIRAQEEGCHALLHVVQALAAEPEGRPPQLVVVTRGAHAVVHQDTVAVAQGPVHGLARVIANEYPKLHCRTIDLPPRETEAEIRALFDELFAEDGEDDIALRDGARFASRVRRLPALPPRRRQPWNGASTPWRIEIDAPGALDRLAFRERPARRPRADEVTIEVRAAALNFRDVMKALGIYPGDHEDDAWLGDECSGRITAVGRSVKRLRVGDPVMAVGPGCLSSRLTMPSALVLRKPRGMRFGDAATIPIAFLTAWYALHHLGKMRKGDRVLVQAATGGVGLAAVQLARLAGAEVFATAGSQEKRELLRALGVAHVMDSRSLAFADEVLALTGGRGVDLVLNSLAGDAIPAGVSALATGGRFLEIGKRDVYQNARLGLRAFRNNISFFVIDLAQIMRDDPPAVASMLERLMPMFADGRLHPLPYRSFRASHAVQALRHMSQARHVGKIVLEMDDPSVVPVPSGRLEPARFRPDGSYMITGGLGGFGLAVAEWMLKRGAGRVVLVSRRGVLGGDARRAVARLRRLGSVLVVKADVADERDVARVFRTIAKTPPPLRGIVHAAMVLDDGSLSQQTAARFDRVMAPKVRGAWNLHVHSRALSLDAFVLFSSVASVAGSPGQAAYVAANAFLESLAHHRRASGLPGLAVNWGVIGEVGFVARNEKLGALLEGTGLGSMKPAEALDVLGAALNSTATQIGVGRIDWQRLAECLPLVGSSPRYQDIVPARDEVVLENAKTFEQRILALPHDARLAVVTEQLQAQVAKVLRTSAAKLDPHRALDELGLDSLMGVELLVRIETALGVSLSAAHLGGGKSLQTMAVEILEAIAGPSPANGPDRRPVPKIRPAIENLVTLRTGGASPPLVCLHPAGGLAIVYEHLASRLPADRSVLGIQSRALAGERPEHTSLGEMAREYAGMIKDRCPGEPVQLLGFSFGGFVAVEVARILEDSGQPPSGVGIIDADLRWIEHGHASEAFLKRHIGEMSGTVSGEFGLLTPFRAEDLDSVSAALAGDTLVATYASLFLTHMKLLAGHAPSVICAPLCVWSGKETRGEGHKWRRYTTASFSEHVVDGAHYDMIRPPRVDELAAQLIATWKAPSPHNMTSDRELAPT